MISVVHYSRYFTLFFRLVFFTTFLCSCEIESGKPSTATEEVQQQITEAIDQYVVKGKSIEELKKLHQIEYKVFTLPIDNSLAKLEGVLSRMGKEKWDCYHIERVSVIREERKVGRLLFFCKRKYDTLLRYVPQSLLGR